MSTSAYSIFLNKNLIKRIEFNVEPSNSEVVYVLLGVMKYNHENELVVIPPIGNFVIIDLDMLSSPLYGDILIDDIGVVSNVVYSDYCEIKLAKEIVNELDQYCKDGYECLILVHTHPNGIAEFTLDDKITNKNFKKFVDFLIKRKIKYGILS